MRRLFWGGAILIRRSIMRWIALAVLAAASFSAVAGTIDVNLSNDTIEGKFSNPVGAADWTFGGLYNRDNSNWFANIGLLAAGDGNVGTSRFSGGLGGKIYTVHAGGQDLGAHAPGVVTFIDGKNFYDTGLRAQVEVFRNSFAYIGYRWTRADFENGAQPYVDTGGFAGIMVKF